VLVARGQDVDALAALDEAVRRYPEFGAAWYARGLAQRRLGRVQDARESLARARSFAARWPGLDDPVLGRVGVLRDDPAARVDRGLQLERREDLDGAIGEYEAALARDPGFTPAHVQLIRAYGRRGNWSESAAHYREVVRLGGDTTDADYSYGAVLLLQGLDADAAAQLRRVVSANPQHASAWHALGQIAERAGRVDEALERYRTAHDCAPSDGGIHFNLGRLLIATRQYREAIAQFEILSAHEGGEQPRYTFGLATALILSGDLARGRKIAIDARALAAARGQADLVAAIERDLAKLPGGGVQ
jgi:Tfp pilus assembly protein PilF